MAPSGFVRNENEMKGFQMKKNLDGVLVRHVNHQRAFEIQNNNKEYFVFICYWGRDIDSKIDAYSYNPNLQEVKRLETRKIY